MIKSLEARKLAKRAGAVLAGREPGVQGAAIGCMLAMWLAGHSLEGHDEVSSGVAAYETKALRKRLLRTVVNLAKSLLEELEKGATDGD